MNEISKKQFPLIYILLFFVIFIWGLSWPINKIALQYIAPIQFAEYRLLIGTVSMFIFILLIGKFILPKRKDIPIILIIGILQRGLFLMLISLGLRYNDVGHSAILVYSTPIWVTPISIVFFKEKSTILDWLGLFLGISGLIILLNPWEIDWSNRNILLGNSMLLLAAICWAVAMLCTRYMNWQRSPLELSPWQLLVGIVPVALLTLCESRPSTIHWNFILISALLYTGVLATAFAYWGTIVVSKILPPATASVYFLGVPVCGILFAWVLLRESPSIISIIAMFLILCGLICIAIKN